MFEDRVTELGEPTEYFNLIRLVQSNVEEFIVSDLPGERHYVGATLWAELEIEVEFYERKRHLDDDDEERRLGPPRMPKYKCTYPCVRVQLRLDVEEQTVRGAKASSIELA